VATYLIRRFFLMLLTLVGISILIFVMLRLVPGNIADILFDAAGMINPAEKAQLEKELGLDRPIAIQYVAWIGGLLHGALGYSYVSEKPAIDEIAPRIPITAKLAALAPGRTKSRRASILRQQRKILARPDRLGSAQENRAAPASGSESLTVRQPGHSRRRHQAAIAEASR